MRREVLIPAVLALLLLVGVLLARPLAKGPSVTSPAADGMLGAFAWLEEVGEEVRAGAVGEAGLDETLVIAFPSAVPWSEEEARRLRDRVFAGQRVVLLVRDARLADRTLLRSLDLGTRRIEEDFPPADWRAWWDREITLEEVGGQGRLLVRRPGRQVTPPARAEVLWRTPEGVTAGFSYGLGQGEVLVHGAGNPFANAWLGDNLGALAALRGPVLFEEAHQAVPPDEADRGPLVVPLARFGWHVLGLYLAGVWALAWRFGPPRRRRAHRAGSLRRDLLAIGALARSGARATEAGDRLLALARASLDPADARRLPGRAEVYNERELVALGRHVARVQGGHR